MSYGERREQKTWADFGIELPPGARGNVRTICPQCSPTRKKKHIKTLVVEADEGTWYCHHCDWRGSLGSGVEGRADLHWWEDPNKPKTYRKPREIQRDPSEIANDHRREWAARMKERGISAATIKRAEVDVVLQWMPQTEQEEWTLAYPYRRKGELINVKYRDAAKNFRMEKEAEQILWRLDAIASPEAEYIIITEGENDALALMEAGFDNVTSVPAGAPNADAKNYDAKFAFLDDPYTQEVLASKRGFILATDADPNGRKLRQELARRFDPARCWFVVWPDGLKDANDVLREHGPDRLSAVIKGAQPAPLEGVLAVDDFREAMDDLYIYGLPDGLSTGWSTLDRTPDGEPLFTVDEGKLCICVGPGGTGKALALDTPIPTPTGWTTQGDLKPGDEVYGSDGAIVTVEAVGPTMTGRPVYALETGAGERILADAEHEWFTYDRRADDSERSFRKRNTGRRPDGWHDQQAKRTLPAVRETREIAETIRTRSRGDLNHSIPLTKPLAGGGALPIDPYTYGAWLGDGHAGSGELTCADPEIITRIEMAGYTCSKQAATYRWTIRGLTTQIEEPYRTKEAIIPGYLRASEADRLAFLTGLMDTDGHCEPSGSCEFVQKRRWIAEAVAELARSFGWTAHVKERRATLRGQDAGPVYRVHFRPDRPIFTVGRKLARQKATRRFKRTMVTACYPVESVPVRCIQVSAADGLYLAGRTMLPTHNSRLVNALAVNVAKLHGWRWALCSPEYRPTELLVMHLAETLVGKPMSPAEPDRMARREYEQAMEWIGEHFHFIVPEETTLTSVLKSATDLTYRYGIKGLIIDPWTEIDLEDEQTRGNDARVLRGALGDVQKWQRRTNVFTVINAHPTAAASRADDGGKVVGMSDISGGAMFGNKADFILSLFRDKDQHDGLIDVYVKKARFQHLGSYGMATLRFDRRTGRYFDAPRERMEDR